MDSTSKSLSILRFGAAFGVASALVRVVCLLVMALTPKETAVRFFNSLVHGIDVGPIMRWDMSPAEMALGIVEIFILGGLFAAVVAALYNTLAREQN